MDILKEVRELDELFREDVEFSRQDYFNERLHLLRKAEKLDPYNAEVKVWVG